MKMNEIGLIQLDRYKTYVLPGTLPRVLTFIIYYYSNIALENYYLFIIRTYRAN